MKNVLRAVLALTMLLLSSNVVASEVGKTRQIWATASQFIQNTGVKAFQELSENITDKQRADRFHTLLTESFDMPVIARFTMGQYWRRASVEQRNEYVDLFQRFVIKTYSSRFKDLHGIFTVKRSIKLVGSSEMVISEVKIDNRTIRINWRVRQSEKGWRVIDVHIEGISMVITQRAEFTSVIRNNGGKVEVLLEELRKKLR